MPDLAPCTADCQTGIVPSIKRNNRRGGSVTIENESAVSTHHKMRRRRGGQKGNQNARKHGFYSGKLSLPETTEMWNIANRENLRVELAVFRVKLQSVLQQDPANRRVLKEAANLLAKWYSSSLEMDRVDTARLKRAVRVLSDTIGDLN